MRARTADGRDAGNALRTNRDATPPTCGGAVRTSAGRRRGAAGAVLALLLACVVGAAAQPQAAGAAGPAVAGPPTPALVYRAPVGPPTTLARAFEAPPAPWAAGHRGVDLRAAVGTDVVAPADGTVTFAGPVAGRGVVTVLHPDGRRSSVEPVVPLVAVGAQVRAGERLGTVGEGGHCTGACLHWGVRVGERYVDPWSLLPGAGPVVLLPLR